MTTLDDDLTITRHGYALSRSGLAGQTEANNDRIHDVLKPRMQDAGEDEEKRLVTLAVDLTNTVTDRRERRDDLNKKVRTLLDALAEAADADAKRLTATNGDEVATPLSDKVAADAVFRIRGTRGDEFASSLYHAQRNDGLTENQRPYLHRMAIEAINQFANGDFVEADGTLLVSGIDRSGEPGFVGEVDERLDLTLTVTERKRLESGSVLHKFEDDEGRTLTWFASEGSTGGSVMLQGETWDVRGTVKSHERFRGDAETHLTRVQPQRHHGEDVLTERKARSNIHDASGIDPARAGV